MTKLRFLVCNVEKNKYYLAITFTFASFLHVSRLQLLDELVYRKRNTQLRIKELKNRRIVISSNN